eukprot:gene11945-29219_t
MSAAGTNSPLDAGKIRRSGRSTARVPASRLVATAAIVDSAATAEVSAHGLGGATAPAISIVRTDMRVSAPSHPAQIHSRARAPAPTAAKAARASTTLPAAAPSDVGGRVEISTIAEVKLLKAVRSNGTIDFRGPVVHPLDARLLSLITEEELGRKDSTHTRFPIVLAGLKLTKEEVIRMKQLRKRQVERKNKGTRLQQPVGAGAGNYPPSSLTNAPSDEPIAAANVNAGELVTTIAQVKLLKQLKRDGSNDCRGPVEHPLDAHLLSLITPEDLGRKDPSHMVFPAKLVDLELNEAEVIRMKQLRQRQLGKYACAAAKLGSRDEMAAGVKRQRESDRDSEANDQKAARQNSTPASNDLSDKHQHGTRFQSTQSTRGTRARSTPGAWARPRDFFNTEVYIAAPTPQCMLPEVGMARGELELDDVRLDHGAKVVVMIKAGTDGSGKGDRKRFISCRAAMDYLGIQGYSTFYRHIREQSPFNGWFLVDKEIATTTAKAFEYDVDTAKATLDAKLAATAARKAAYQKSRKVKAAKASSAKKQQGSPASGQRKGGPQASHYRSALQSRAMHGGQSDNTPLIDAVGAVDSANQEAVSLLLNMFSSNR